MGGGKQRGGGAWRTEDTFRICILPWFAPEFKSMCLTSKITAVLIENCSDVKRIGAWNLGTRRLEVTQIGNNAPSKITQ